MTRILLVYNDLLGRLASSRNDTPVAPARLTTHVTENETGYRPTITAIPRIHTYKQSRELRSYVFHLG